MPVKLACGGYLRILHILFDIAASTILVAAFLGILLNHLTIVMILSQAITYVTAQ
jgi:hypothetical protein